MHRAWVGCQLELGGPNYGQVLRIEQKASIPRSNKVGNTIKTQVDRCGLSIQPAPTMTPEIDLDWPGRPFQLLQSSLRSSGCAASR